MAAPFFDWLKRTTERFTGKFYEGPEPPKRIRAMVEAFAATHPKATRAEWLEHSVQLAEECYRSGYTRGFERYDRDPSTRPDEEAIEELAEAQRHDWSWAGPTAVDRAIEDQVPDDSGAAMSLEDQAAYLEMRDVYERENRMGRGPRRL